MARKEQTRSKLGREYENMSTIDIIKKHNGIGFIPKAEYAWFDESTNRWRAGRLSKYRTGQFISGASARSSRGMVNRLNNRINVANTLAKQRNLEPVEAWKISGKYISDLKKAKNVGIMNRREYVDEMYGIRSS